MAEAAGKRKWLTAAQFAASAALLAAAVILAKPEHLWEEAAGGRIELVALSVLFVPVLVMLRTVRWHILARTRRPEMTLAECLHSYLAGLALATVTPWAAGELARGALAAPDDKAGFVGLTFLDKMMDLTGLFIFACAGLVWVGPWQLKALAAGGAVAAAAGWALVPEMSRLAGRMLPHSRFTGALRRAVSASGSVPRGALALALALAAANLTVYYLQLYVIMYAFAPEIELQAVGLFPLITLSRVVPSIGGLGVREFVAGALFARGEYEVSSAAAMVASFSQYVIANVVPAAAWLASTGGFRRYVAQRRPSGD